MKRTILPSMILVAGLLISSSVIVGCNRNTEKKDQPTQTDGAERTDSLSVAYACPMHPEITGGENDRCSKCGMRLEPVKEEEDTTQISTEFH